MASFQYQALPDPRAWIRLMRLQPGSGNMPLKASLDTVKLQEKPPYEALSYYWGIDKRLHRLTLRDSTQECDVLLTENLNLALLRMRHKDKERTIWTDAICINQLDDREKANQVRFMGEIYETASRVLVYLGEQDKWLSRAEELLDKIHHSAMTIPNDQRSALQWVIDSGLPSLLESLRWEPLKALFRRPWFRRTWTIQECALARQLTFYCGDWEREWDWMSLVIQTIYDKGLGVTDYTTSTNEEEARQLQQGISQIQSIKRYRQGRQQNLNYPILEIVYGFQTSEAKRKRDHLFALLGMAADSGTGRLDPEYGTTPLLQIYLRYAHYFLERSQNLELLYRAGLTCSEMFAPSWIPNWYGGHQTFGIESNEGFWNPMLRPAHLHMTRGTNVQLTTGRNSIVLGLKGVVIDTIADTAYEHLMIPADAWRSKTSMLDRQRQHLIQSDKIMHRLQSYSTGEDIMDVQWRTLMCNTTRSGIIPDNTFRDKYAAWRRRTLREPVSSAQLQAEFAISQPFDRVIGSWNVDRTFGLTSEGYVGMFPQQTKKGDRIAVLYGGEFPFVLRPCDKPHPANYQLVGQCYVHGIMMEGQFDLQAWKPQEQAILLGGDFTEVSDTDKL